MYLISPDAIRNKLLAALPKTEYQRLLPQLEPVSLSFKQLLYECNAPIDYVYFLNNCVVSLIRIMEDGGVVEVATIGNEGIAGLPVLLGANHSPNETFVQVPGDALRMKADVFRSEVAPGSPLHNLLLRYTQALMNMLAQSVACNRLHSIEERCCRWLLLTRDRVNSNKFPLTRK